MPTKNIALAMALFPIALGGCLTAPVRSVFAQPTGQPLEVEEVAETGTYTAQVKTGSIKDTDGNVIANTYENRTRHYTNYSTVLTQGGQPIDPESFARIAGDEESIARYDEYHRKGHRQHKTGLIMAVVGAAAMSVSVMIEKLSPEEPSFAFVGAGFGFGMGMLIYGGNKILDGRKIAVDENPSIEIGGGCSAFLAAAELYNQNIPEGALDPAGLCLQ
jgi:hypothetical protein